jgi:hypothetical protein
LKTEKKVKVVLVKKNLFKLIGAKKKFSTHNFFLNSLFAKDIYIVLTEAPCLILTIFW